jgi:hypothetical protein
MQVSFKGAKMIKHKINEITCQIVESILHKDQQDANVMINQLTIMMYNRHLLQVQEELSSEKLLLPSRVSLVYDRFFNLFKDSDITNMELTIEPFDLKVGFRELDNFKEIQKLFTDFQTRINQTKPTEIDVDSQTYEEQQLKSQSEDEKAMIKQIEKVEVKQVAKRVSFKDRKTKQLIKMNVRLISESINFSLMDDTGLHEYPLINFNISKILANYETETGEDDAANFILKKMGISRHPFQKIEAGLLLESNYFNVDSGSYEPLIEPWTFSYNVNQKTVSSAKKISLKSEEMLNLSVTYGMALALQRLMKKMNQEAASWEDEKKVEEVKVKTKRFTSGRQTSSNRFASGKSKSLNDGEESDDAAGYIFENNLGVAMRVTLENYDSWLEQGISFNEDDKEAAVLNFQEWEEGEQSRVTRLQRDFVSINKYVKKEQNGGKLVENFEDQIMRCDIYIEGYEPVTGVPIEITGLRSYELTVKGELTSKKKKTPKYQNSIVVNIKPEGNKKAISFESQLILTNKTEHEIMIAQVFTSAVQVSKEEMTDKEIEGLVEILKQKNKQTIGGQSGVSIDFNLQDIEIFAPIYANATFKVPLKWFLHEVDIYYR